MAKLLKQHRSSLAGKDLTAKGRNDYYFKKLKIKIIKYQRQLFNS
jgi:hypothetical protein